MIRFPALRFGQLFDWFYGGIRSSDAAIRPDEQAIQTNTLHGLLNSSVVNLVGPFTAIFAVHIGASNVANRSRLS